MKIHSVLLGGTVDGPGVRTVVFAQGCRYRCRYCHNPDSWAMDGGKEMAVEELFLIASENRAYYGRRGGITVSGGEPLLQAQEVAELFRLCRGVGIRTCLDTAGSVWNADVESLLAVTDLVLLDVKHADPDAYRALTGGELSDTLAFVTELNKHDVPYWVRHVCVPEWTDTLEEVTAVANLVPHAQKIELIAYHTLGLEKWEKLGRVYPLAGVPPLASDKLEKLQRAIDRTC